MCRNSRAAKINTIFHPASRSRASQVTMGAEQSMFESASKLEAKKDFAGAMAAYKEVIKLNPKLAAAHNCLGCDI